MQVISVENVDKLYRLGVINRGLLYQEIESRVARWLGKPDPHAPVLSEKDKSRLDHENNFWALRGISFTVDQGEVVGIIGKNGAGKSTLLKLLSRITSPTAGVIKVRGRMAALLEVGTGFHPDLTGRENVYLNGAILGMSRAEVHSKFDEILAFAEIEDFIDTPVKRYSSGMYVRLAFSVAAHLEPEILVIDEVLAVGDASFQRKCIGKMGEVAGQGRTVLFVSHNMNSVSRLCERVIWLEDGKVRESGPSEEMVTKYLLHSVDSDAARKEWDDGLAFPGVTDFKLLEVGIKNHQDAWSNHIELNKEFSISITYRLTRPLSGLRVALNIMTNDGIIVFESFDQDDSTIGEDRPAGTHTSTCTVPAHLLNSGTYVLTVGCGMPGKRRLASAENVLLFTVEDTGSEGMKMRRPRRGLVRPLLSWNITTH